MMDLLTQLPSTAINILVLLLVVLVKSLSEKFSSQKQIAIFSLYCAQLAEKVNKETHSKNHRKIAGFIATIITFSPLVIIVWLFETLVAIEWLWGAILLYFSFGRFNVNACGKNIAKNLNAQDNQTAKLLLTPLMLRDVEKLSALGISKATIEMMLLRKFQQHFMIGFYFFLLGPITAFSVRLLLEMHYHWNIKVAKFTYFGSFVNFIVNVVQWLPSRLFLFLLILTSLNQSIVLFWRLIRTQFFVLNNSILIHYFALILSVKLGGVAMYNQEKLRKLSFNEQGVQPQAKDIILAIKQLNLVMTLVFGLLISTLVIFVLLSSY